MDKSNQESMTLISRYVSTFGGAFRAFMIYKHDNKVIDEILNGLRKRFSQAIPGNKPLELGVTSLSLTYKGNPVGFQDVTSYLATTLRYLGIKEITFTPPIQNRHFFALFNILSNKDSKETKLDKLRPYLDNDNDEEEKPILLTPLSASSIILRLPDEVLKNRLSFITTPSSKGGPGFIEAMEKSQIDNIPDLFSWSCIHAETLPKNLRAFVRTLCDATREGYFSFERFLDIFPMPPALHALLKEEITYEIPIRERRKTALGHRFIPLQRRAPLPHPTLSHFSHFNNDDIVARRNARAKGLENSAIKDLELAQTLMNEPGANFTMGLRLLLRILENKNTVAAQEKALKLGIRVWSQFQHMVDDVTLVSLLSHLRQNLTAPHNLTLILYPLRNLTMESDLFQRISKFVISLGDASFPAIISALEAEQERSMRKKLCFLLTLIAREHGTEFLLESTQSASHFLLRNIIMVLGDVKSAGAVQLIERFIMHDKKIIRTEAVRSLIKIGDKSVVTTFSRSIMSIPDLDIKRMVIHFLMNKKDRHAVDGLVRLAQDKQLPTHFRRELYNAIGVIGGFQAKQFLQSQKKTSILGSFNSDERELQTLIKSLLEKMA